MKYIVLGMMLLVALCEAHLCLFNPLQRGPMNDVNSAGTDDCILLEEPCGGRYPEKPKLAVLVVEEPYTIVFQKNLDHFNQSNPGMFVVSISEGDSTFEELGKVADSATPSLHVYQLNVTLPKRLVTHSAVLQVKYVTNNPEAPPIFYQCADILLL